MAFTTQILEDGHRNAQVLAVFTSAAADLAVSDLADPANFSPRPTQFRIDRIQYNVSQQLQVQLFWDATADVLIADLAGMHSLEAQDVGGLQNNAGAGKTGKIQVQTTGWASGTQGFTLLLWLVKQGV